MQPAMVYLSLYRKYRPETFDEILGQEAVSATLANAIAEDRVAHAYLFTGPRGTGKTSTARILAKALNCERGPTPTPCGVCASCVAISEGSSLDVIEMDAASHSKVDETREILAGVPLATAGGRRKVYVIDEVHMLSTPSFNALLKTLEEPPAHVLFVLATTEAHKVLPTIISRTQRFDFRRLPADLLADHLAHIAKLEGLEAEPEALATIARHADGSARDALSVLDQLASLGGRIETGHVERLLGERTQDALADIFDAIAAGAVGSVFTTLHALVAEGLDARQLAVGALAHARSLLLLKTAPEAQDLLDVGVEDAARFADQSERFSAGALLRTMDLLGKSLTEMRNVPNHRLLLELALVRAAAPDTDPSANGLLGRIERLERRMGIEPVPDAVEAAPPAPPAIPVAEEAPSAAPQPAAPVAEDAASPPEPAPCAPSGADHVGLGHIKDAWAAILREVNKRSKKVWGLLNPSHPLQLEDGVLVVEVQSEFHESTMGLERNRDLLAEAVHAALGIRPDLRFAARRAAAPPPVADDAVDLADAAPVSERHDPIELVKKGFSAEVVEEREP
jgi:DNA polymerase-3 subunit gamma/tau